MAAFQPTNSLWGSNPAQNLFSPPAAKPPIAQAAQQVSPGNLWGSYNPSAQFGNAVAGSGLPDFMSQAAAGFAKSRSLDDEMKRLEILKQKRALGVDEGMGINVGPIPKGLTGASANIWAQNKAAKISGQNQNTGMPTNYYS